MLFNSTEFFIFLPIIFILYWFVLKNSFRLQNILLLAASYFFYGWFDWRFVGLLVLSTVIDYSFGFWVANGTNKKKKLFLWLSIFNNLIILGFFKYYNFFVTECAAFLGTLGFNAQPYILSIVLPLGISFYTFHGMSYVLDIYRGHFKPIANFIDYAVFVCFFPLLVAGPIERASHLLPQITSNRRFKYAQGIQGLRLMLWGFFKKVVVADSLAPVVDNVYNNYHTMSGSTVALGAIYFSIQIYCDFSGYTDIALGCAKLFGFELLTNFRFPYFSRNIAEFWRRWHISLSSWFRDYLYIPLGGGRTTKAKAVRNTFIIFLVSGFWHGANWTFIIWGGIHALLFIPLLLGNKNRQFTGNVVAHDRILPNLIELGQMLFTFMLTTLAWVFFRSPDIATSLAILKQITINFFEVPALKSFMFYYVVPLILIDWHFRRDERAPAFPQNKVIRYFTYAFMFFTIIYHSNNNASFIYFQF
jgi:D-alanyl-lipoteichoic acid acyltransferase DltB (MBOAT superfamily)